MDFKGFVLDRFQEEAIASIEKDNSVIVSAPTGSGKTLIADFIIDKSIKEGKKVIYTAPIKALSNQKYKDFVDDYGEDRIGLITGDQVINPAADILVMTTEVYRNMAIVNDRMLDCLSYCIMDEIHYISDEERGHVWEESIIFSPASIRFLFLSATIPNAEEFSLWVAKIKNHAVDVITYSHRPVPLDIKFYDSELGITTLDDIKKKKDLDDIPEYRSLHSRGARFGRYKKARVPLPDFTLLIKELNEMDKLPCIYFVFSRAKTQDYAQKLSEKNSFLDKDEKAKVAKIVQEKFNGISRDVAGLKSTMIQRQCLSKGIAFHHAGLLPDIKHIVEKLFSEGLIKVLFATETFAVGINMPARTVCFDSLRKYTGTGFRYLTTKEFFQISGRAGRRGMDLSGLSVSVVHRPSAELRKIKEITEDDTLPIVSQFRLSYNTVLNMINLYNENEIDQILRMNFHTFQELGNAMDDTMLSSIKARYDNAKKTLERMGYVKDGSLTELGVFTTRIFSDEIELSQIFKGDVDLGLDEYRILLILAALAYEEKREVRFYKEFSPKLISELAGKLKSHPFLKKGMWIKNMHRLSALIRPCYEQKTFVEILKNTNMPEGDLMRLFLQVLDRLEQADRALGASEDDERKRAMVRNCKHLIKGSLEGIGVF